MSDKTHLGLLEGDSPTSAFTSSWRGSSLKIPQGQRQKKTVSIKLYVISNYQMTAHDRPIYSPFAIWTAESPKPLFWIIKLPIK